MKNFFFFFLILVICFNFVYAIPELPMIITGEVIVNEKPAKVGTEIIAKVNNNEVSKLEIKEEGRYTLLLQKLEDDEEVKIYVDNIDTLETISYKSGDFKQLTLKVEKPYLVNYLMGGLIIALAALLVLWVLKRK